MGALVVLEGWGAAATAAGGACRPPSMGHSVAIRTGLLVLCAGTCM
jgi:hypothetical protein